MILKRYAIIIWTLAVLGLMASNAAANLPEFTELAEKAGSAVVNISTEKTVKGVGPTRNPFNMPPGDQNPFFEDFFKQFDRFFNQPQRPRKQRSLGSGFIISADGYIVTNNHVVDQADKVTINLQGGREGESYEAEVIGRDPETDLALLKIKADVSLPTLSFGDSDEIKVGEWVMAIGNPFGLNHTVTAGIVSAKGRIIGSGPYDDFIQTDASINPGNSGGPLLNMDGQVVGINTLIIASGQGIGFAIPSNMAKNVINQLKTHKEVKRGWIGVEIQGVDKDLAKALDMDEPSGALVASVIPGDPADKAGIKAGDVIIEINGKSIDDTSDLLRKIAEVAPGEKAKVVVLRKGDKKNFTITLAQRDTAHVTQRGPGKSGSEKGVALGLTLRPVEKSEAPSLGLDKAAGLLVTRIEPDSPAAESDIRPRDVILEVNYQPVESIGQFKDIVKKDSKKKGVVLLLIKRQGQNLFRTINIK